MDSDERLPSLEALQRKIDETNAAANSMELGAAEAGGTGGTKMTSAMSMAWNMVSGASVGAIGGYFIDGWLQMSPVFIITGFFLGFGVGLYALMLQVKKDI